MKKVLKNRNIHRKAPLLKFLFNKVAGLQEHLRAAASVASFHLKFCLEVFI